MITSYDFHKEYKLMFDKAEQGEEILIRRKGKVFAFRCKGMAYISYDAEKKKFTSEIADL